jgi:hypothetical protein
MDRLEDVGVKGKTVNIILKKQDERMCMNYLSLDGDSGYLL